jgi:hypothetical protein
MFSINNFVNYEKEREDYIIIMCNGEHCVMCTTGGTPCVIFYGKREYFTNVLELMFLKSMKRKEKRIL